MTTRIASFASLLLLLAACGSGDVVTDTSSTPAETAATSVAGDTTTTADTTTTTAPTATAEPAVPTSIAKPEPGDLVSAVVVTGTGLELRESDPVQVHLKVSAQLPTPCHEATWDVEDDGSTITVVLGAQADPDQICVDMIEEAELDIDLGDFPTGSSRTVILNGETVGDFDL
jgi:hypothetical protein